MVYSRKLKSPSYVSIYGSAFTAAFYVVEVLILCANLRSFYVVEVLILCANLRGFMLSKF